MPGFCKTETGLFYFILNFFRLIFRQLYFFLKKSWGKVLRNRIRLLIFVLSITQKRKTMTTQSIDRSLVGCQFSFVDGSGKLMDCTVVDFKQSKHYFIIQWKYEGAKYSTPEGVHIPKQMASNTTELVQRMCSHLSKSRYA